MNKNLDETQFSKSSSEGDKPQFPKRSKTFLPAIIAISVISILAISILLSGYIGFKQGTSQLNGDGTQISKTALDQEYLRGVEDFEAGNYYIASQRFEFIYEQDPTYKLALDRWVEIQVIMNTTATPTPLPAGPTITPTPDGRPKEELFNLVISYVQAQNWSKALETLSSLRNVDPFYRVTELDGFIYLSLRNLGSMKVLEQGKLEEGLYDFTLAEQFGPLDIEARNYRDWARLYLQGNGFWMAYPDIAAFYYGQVAGIVPYLSDSTGMTAFFRYWSSLIQYAEKLATEENWCDSNEQYQIANAAAGLDENIMATSLVVQENCFNLTPSATPTLTSTFTVTPTITGTITTGTPTPTVTGTGTVVAETGTPTNTSTVTQTPTQTPTQTSTPTETLTDTPMP